MYSKWFTDALDDLFPAWRKYSNILERFLDDNIENGIPYQEVLTANSLETLKEKARRIERKHKLFEALRTGQCYASESDSREAIGCPRLFAQSSSNRAVLNAFPCHGVFCIPECRKFASGECWKRFDELGFKIQKDG